MDPQGERQQPHEEADSYERPGHIIDIGDPPKPPAEEAKHGTECGHREPKQRGRPWLRRMTKPMSQFTLVIMLASMGQCLSSSLQWDSMQRQFNEMVAQTEATKKSTETVVDVFRAEKRAWLQIDSIDVREIHDLPPGSVRTFWYNFKFRNLGGTAARDIRIGSSAASAGHSLSYSKKGIDMSLEPFKSAPKLPTDTDPTLKESISPIIATLGPGSVTPIPHRMVGSLPQNNRTLYTFLIGRVDYVDEFKTPHWLTFCFIVYGTEGGLNYCWYGNDEDKNGDTMSQSGR